MNKFTRSQMGKIMACALSAAMAVTVVPTYMKPVTVFAATVVADESALDDLAEELYIAELGDTGDAAVRVYYVASGGRDLTQHDTDGYASNIDEDIENGTIADAVSLTVSTIDNGASLYLVLDETSLEAAITKLGADGDFYYATATAESDLATEVVDTTTDFDDATKYYKVSATSLNNDDGIKVYYTQDSGENYTEIASVNSILDTTNSKIYLEAEKIDNANLGTKLTNDGDKLSVAYTITPDGGSEGAETTFATITATEEAEIGDATTIQQGNVLYTYEVNEDTEVKLYAKVGDTEPAYTLTATDYNKDGDYEIVVPYTVATGKYFINGNEVTDPVLEVKAGSAITGVTLNATNTNIYYFGTNGATGSNTETITVDLKGASDKTVLGVEIDDSDISEYFNISQTSATTIDVSMKTDLSASQVAAASGKLKVRVYVAGRTSSYEKTITLKAVKGTAVATGISISKDSEIVTTDTEVKFTIKPTNTTEETLTYRLEDTDVAHSAYKQSTSNGVVSLKNGNKIVATFDTVTGILKATEAGEYKVTATGSVSSVTANTTVEVINPVIETVAGVVGSNTNNTISVTGLPTKGGVNSYVTYKVEDTNIATITGLTGGTVTFAKPGITKVTASIISYTTNGSYTFETSGYIVVSPADTEDFEITSIDDVEVYANELEDNSLLTNELAFQLAEGIVDGKVNAKKLSKDAYELAEDELRDEYSNYYDINAEDDNVTATGLLFATYDSSVTDVEDPEDRVSVGLAISDLQAKDQKYKVDGSTVNFVAEATVDGDVVELNQPVWLTVTNSGLEEETVYTIYDDGEAVFVAKSSAEDANGDVTLTFQTTSFSVFSLVATPNATLTDNSVDLGNKDDVTTSDIYDKVNFVAHVQRRIGTDDKADIEQTLSEDGVITIGTHGQSRRIEKITLTGLDAEDVEMTAHVQKRVDHPEDIADLTQVVNEDGSISIGTEHQSRRIEAFSMKLKGDLAEQYDVYYRVHAQNYGWLGWAKNGETAGTSGHSFRLEGIEIIFVEKGTEFDETQYAKTTEEGDRGYAGQAAYMDRK